MPGEEAGMAPGRSCQLHGALKVKNCLPSAGWARAFQVVGPDHAKPGGRGERVYLGARQEAGVAGREVEKGAPRDGRPGWRGKRIRDHAKECGFYAGVRSRGVIR